MIFLLFILSSCGTNKRQTNQGAYVELQQRLADDRVHGEAMSNSEEGFTETDNLRSELKSFEESIINSLFSTPSYDSQLTIRFKCTMKGSIIPLYPRFKDVKWVFVDQSTKANFKQGEVQTDTEGFARIRFSSSESLYRKKIEISIGTVKRQIELSSIPQEITLTEDGCLNARK